MEEWKGKKGEEVPAGNIGLLMRWERRGEVGIIKTYKPGTGNQISKEESLCRWGWIWDCWESYRLESIAAAKMKDCSGVMLTRTEEHGRSQPFFLPTVSVDNSLLVEANREQPRNCLAKEKCRCSFSQASQSTVQKRGFKAEMESLNNQHRNSPFPKVSWYIIESALNKKQSSRQRKQKLVAFWREFIFPS